MTTKTSANFTLDLPKATIERLSHEGRGVSKVEGKTTFIENALPGEEVLFRYLKKHNKYDEAVAESILVASADRVLPGCTHFSTCGGCRLQHYSSKAQITFKQDVLLEQLEHIAKVAPLTVLPPLVGPFYGYRRKARLGVRFVTKKNRVLIGFHEKNGRYIADILSCPILDPQVSHLLEPLAELIGKLAGYRDIPQIEIAVGDDEKAFVFRHLQPLSNADQASLVAFGAQYRAHIYLQPGSLKSTHRIWPETGEERLSYRFPQQDITLKFHPQDFIQVNAKMNQQMVERVLSLLEPTSQDYLLDLFCGLGNFTLPLARYCQAAIGVEGDGMMVERATENAAYNGLTNTQFFRQDLTRPFDACAFAQQKYHKVLLDPPRSGAREILGSIAALNPRRIVYISCNPATLARDTGELVHQYGFKLMSVGVMDMFAHTCHVESIAVFEKNHERFF